MFNCDNKSDNFFTAFKNRFSEIYYNLKIDALKNKISKTTLSYGIPIFILLFFSLSVILPSNISALDKSNSNISVISNQTYLTSPENINFDIKQNFDEKGTDAYGIYINGNFISAIENQAQIDFLLNGLLILENRNLSCSGSSFIENINCIKGKYSENDIYSYNEIKDILVSKSSDTINYKVKTNDTKDYICSLFSVSEEDILSLNNIDLNCLKPGDILTIKLSNPIINIISEKIENYNVPINFSTSYVNNDNLYSDSQNCIVKGQNGNNNITDNVKYINNIEVSRTNLSSAKTAETVNEVIEVGTKALGESVNSFIWPVPCTRTITSGFGPRWGTLHKGIDIASLGCYGQNIVASDGGVVTCASDLNDGYGIHVIIDHGNGYKTLYGHTSEVLVSVGDKVSQGQTIALIGSTGNSTGPHLHYEIIENSVNLDPENFY